MGPALSFTYVIGAVALERGVADDKRARINVDGTTAALKTEVQRWMSHRRTWSTEPVKRVFRNRKTDPHVAEGGVALKSACLNCQSAA